MTTSKSIQMLVGDICRAMCEQPEAIKVTTRDLPRTISLEIHPAACDVSKIIGKQGNNIKAIQIIAEAMGDSLQRRVYVSVIPTGDADGYKKYAPNLGYEAGDEAALLSEVLGVIYHDGVVVKPSALDERSSALIVEGIEHIDGDLEQAIATVFNAIGKNKGHELIVEIE